MGTFQRQKEIWEIDKKRIGQRVLLRKVYYFGRYVRRGRGYNMQ